MRLRDVAYDFGGNLTAQQRRLATGYETTHGSSALDAAVPPTAGMVAARAQPAPDARSGGVRVHIRARHIRWFVRVLAAVTADGSTARKRFRSTNDAGLLACTVLVFLARTRVR